MPYKYLQLYIGYLVRVHFRCLRDVVRRHENKKVLLSARPTTYIFYWLFFSDVHEATRASRP